MTDRSDGDGDGAGQQALHKGESLPHRFLLAALDKASLFLEHKPYTK